jgi:hypothetical protein
LLDVVLLLNVQVKLMSSEDTEHKELFRRNLSNTNLQALGDQAEGEHHDDFSYEDHQQLQPMSPVSPRRLTGEIIRFHRVALDAPDGMPLVRLWLLVTCCVASRVHKSNIQ